MVAQLLMPVRIEAAQPLDALLDRRVGVEQRSEALRRERVDRVERLRRRRCLELDELRRVVEAQKRIRKPVRGAAPVRRREVGLELALRDRKSTRLNSIT